ncbi:hypothetical protein [Fulvivirga lutimaris]|uniref:hypothetical protein n=1 Tax=Fulvivirga lutimaris TaxID=1819566 RepID=UPI0012BBA50F|nr:hypothetical protein [Fulvivirga lutimaris]MTI38775.1 hypothetical protein [Fulvivirga lutimaris]
MRLFSIIILAFLVFPSLTFAQKFNNDNTKYFGVAILDNKTTKKGKFKYHQGSESIHFNDGTTLNANQTLYFQYYDDEQKLNHYYFSLKNKNGELGFYELLLNGKILLYKKDILVEKNHIDTHQTLITMNMGHIIEPKLYYIDNDTIQPLELFEQDILPKMKGKMEQVSQYIVLNQLNMNFLADQITIIDYFNEIQEQ